MNQLCSTLKDQNFSPVTGSLFFFIWRGFTFYKHKMSALTIIILQAQFLNHQEIYFLEAKLVFQVETLTKQILVP